MNSKNNSYSFVGKFLFLIMVLLMGAIFARAFYVGRQEKEMRDRCTVAVQGTCVDITSETKTEYKHYRHRHGSSKVKTRTYAEYTLHISFTVDGKEYEALTKYNHKPSVHEGDSIEVLYDPEDPTNNYVPN